MPFLDRQALKSEVKGKTLSDETTLGSLGLSGDSTLYFKDLGPQIGWGTVFLAEYAGPLFVYLERFKMDFPNFAKKNFKLSFEIFNRKSYFILCRKCSTRMCALLRNQL